MFENKYNSETNTNEAEYIPVPEVENKKKNGGFRKMVKAVAALCCIAAVSVGSVAVYRNIDNKNTDKNENKTEISENAAANEESTDTDYEVMSLLQLSQSEGALTTQEIYQKVLPSVVGVTSTFTYRQQNGYGGMFGYSNQGGATGQVQGTGTGIIMSADGYIVTNAHVVYDSEYGGKASAVSILLSNEEEYTAEIIGYDTQTDIAVLKVNDAPQLTAAEFGDSSALSVGDTALAIGNPLGFDLFGTLTVGYISGLNREIAMDDAVMHLIQTDAAINSGNSGGPLVNDKGQVIGINSMKMSSSYSSSEASIEGLGFAIPINEAQEIVNDLMNNGYVTGRPQLGITCQDVTSAQNSLSGVYVVGVNENGAADKAGLQAGDVIVGVNGQQVSTITELNRIKNEFKAGDTLKLTVIRENKYTEINVVLEESVVMTENTPEEQPSEETVPENNPAPEENAAEEEDYNRGGNSPFDMFPGFGFDFPF